MEVWDEDDFHLQNPAGEIPEVAYWSGESGLSLPAPAPFRDDNISDHETRLQLGISEYSRIRLLKELDATKKDPLSHCSCGPVGNDIFEWQGVIMGPECTPYEGGLFFLSIHIPEDYPNSPPEIKFKTKVIHPNIDEDGTIHLDILWDRWTPVLTIEWVLLSICSLLADPNADISFNPIAILYRNNREEYNKKTKEWTRKYAMC
ncbi:PREDICTED: ubiquitin-conjugating enzyme E2 D1-like isoform X2 [Nelumbo nucifera]|uniref:Ubiquitin-conjugating enzyme E2 D1-like isoform X2 n=1 Tax=Nelumbo nucifera TaxID=4432 RepID=A0A1U8B0B5_NELNU|nr:PREDICTED: ubiquitin-conjugating enzyme E2 D1-like isoform X2 [Nelumbo nucifera]